MKKNVDRTVLTVAILGSLVFLNVIGIRAFGRLDLTRDKQFTLSDATRRALAGLSDPLTIRAYFTRDLPPPYSTNARYVRDLLEEYYAHADGNLRFEFIDPTSEETEEDKEKKKDVKHDIFGRAVREATSIERELGSLGIQPVQVRVNEDDKLEVKRAYMGLAIKYGDKSEVIPVVQETAGLEYDLTTLIRKITRVQPPKVAVVTGFGGPDLQKDLATTNGILGQLYDVTTVDLSTETAIPEGVSAVLVVGPKTALSDAARRTIDAFIMAGGSAAFLLDAIKPDLSTLQTEDAAHGLADMLATYGVKVEDGLVLDAECATITIAQQRGFMRIQQPVRYPFMPLPQQLDPEHPLTRGLAGIAFPFVSPLTVTVGSGADDAIKAEVLVKSSERSWVQRPPYNLDPLQRWTVDAVSEQGAKNLVVTLSGAIKSHFAAGSEAQPGVSVANNARVLVAGTSTFVQDQFMSRANETLLLNMMDWLILDDALLAVRSRGLAAAPLEELSDGARNGVKYGNIVGVPLAFVGVGLVRWRRREARRSKVTL